MLIMCILCVDMRAAGAGPETRIMKSALKSRGMFSWVRLLWFHIPPWNLLLWCSVFSSGHKYYIIFYSFFLDTDIESKNIHPSIYLIMSWNKWIRWNEWIKLGVKGLIYRKYPIHKNIIISCSSRGSPTSLDWLI